MDERLPFPPLSQPVTFGYPYHGIVVGTTLTLPNTETRTYPAISSNDCYDFHVPGAPDGAGLPVPDGGEWRDYLLINYGSTGPIIYGKQGAFGELAWLYVHTDGTRWMIKITSSLTGHAFSSASLEISFSARRFGEFGSSAETQTFSVTLADRGLGDTLATEITESLPSTASIGISDISSDGANCCLMFYADKTGDDSINQRFPYAFFEIALSSSAFSSSTATLLYDIAEVSGTNRDYAWDTTADDDIDVPSECTWYNKTVTQNAGSEGVADSIIACWYVDDVITAIKFDYEHVAVEEEITPLQYVDSGNNVCGTEFDETTTATAEATVSIGSTATGSVAVILKSEIVTTRHEERRGYLALPDITIFDETREFTIEVSSVAEFSSNYVYDTAVGYDSVIWYTPTENTQFSLGQARLTEYHPWALDDEPSNSPADFEIPQFFVKRFSSTLLGIGWTWIDAATSERKHKISRFLTKNGSIVNTYSIPVDTAIGQLSATVQPVTYDINFIADGAWRAFV